MKEFFGTIFGLIFIAVAILGFFYYISFQYQQQKKEQERVIKSGIYQIDNMTGYQFEYYLYVLFIKLGYRVEKTSKTRDYGADLILYLKDKKIVVQAKRYKRNVGIKSVQEINSAKDYYHANEAWVVTNRFFTEQAKNLSAETGTRLVDRNDLIDYILKIKNQNKNEIKDHQI